MNFTKNIGLTCALLASLVLISTFVAAADNATISLSFIDSQLSYGQNASLIVTNTNSTASIPSVKLESSGFELTFSKNNFALGNSSKETITIIPQNIGSLAFGRHTATITATGQLPDGQVQSSTTLTLDKGLCAQGPRGTNLSINSVDFKDLDEGDDTEWQRLDHVQVEVKVENNGDDTIDNVIVEMVLYDSSNKKKTNDLEFSNTDEEKIDLGDLGDGDDDTALFEFKVPADIDSGNYKLGIKVYSDGDEDLECADSSDDLNNDIYQTIDIKKATDDGKTIVVDDIQLPTDATCGETVTGSFGVFNIGGDDEDQVQIMLANKDIGLNQEFEIRDNLDDGDSKTVDFSFDLPNSIKDGTYSLEFKTFYDYRNGAYRQESDESFRAPLKIIGCGGSTNGGSDRPTADITPSLKSTAKAGEKLIVDALILNSGSQRATFTLDASGYESWAKLASLSQRSVTLEPGQSQTVTLSFDVNSDVAGTQSFVIQANANGSLSTQEVEVNLASPNSSGFSFSGNASLLWIIGIINVVLIILIIVVAVRLSRR